MFFLSEFECSAFKFYFYNYAFVTEHKDANQMYIKLFLILLYCRNGLKEVCLLVY